MSRNTRDTICATIGLVIVILLLTTVAALDEPVVPDTPPAVPPAVEDKLPGEGVPASGCAYLTAEPLGLFELTAYCPCSRCCGKNDGITATGTVATEGRTVAVDPNVIPYGTTIEVIYPDGSRARYVAEDCGGAIKAQRLDVFFADHQTAREYGIRTAYVFLVQEGGGNEYGLQSFNRARCKWQPQCTADRAQRRHKDALDYAQRQRCQSDQDPASCAVRGLFRRGPGY